MIEDSKGAAIAREVEVAAEATGADIHDAVAAEEPQVAAKLAGAEISDAVAAEKPQVAAEVAGAEISDAVAAEEPQVAAKLAGAEIHDGVAAEEPIEVAPVGDAKEEVIDEEVKPEPAAPESVPTIREIFGMPAKGVADPSDERWKAVEDRLTEEVKGIKWTAAMSDLAPKLCDLLEIKVPDVLLAAWKKAKELQAVIEKSKQTPEEITYLELADHAINSEHKPSIDVKLRGAKVKTIQILVQLGFKLKGFVLKIQNGSILEMQTGQCEAKGTIKYAGLAIAEKKLAPIRLPLSIPIDTPEPVTLPAPQTESRNEDEAPAVEHLEL